MEKGTPTQDEKDVVALIYGALDSFSAGDVETFRTTWAAHDVDIVDDVAPYIWKGENSLDRWMADTGAAISAMNLTNLKITPAKPLRVEVEGDRAFVVLPVVVSSTRPDGRNYRQDGQQVIVLSRTASGWVMQTMSYAGGMTLRVE